MALSALSVPDALPLLNAVLRGGAAALLVLASAVFLRAPSSLPSRFGAALALCGILAALAGLPSIAILDPFDPLVALCSAACVPLFWLFTRAWFDDDFRPTWIDAAVGGSYPVLGLIISLQHEAPIAPLGLLDLLSSVGGAAFAVHALWLAWRSRNTDLVEPRRHARIGFIAIVSAIILILTGSEVAGRITGAIETSTLTGAIVLFAGALGLLIILVGLRHPDMFPAPAEAQANAPQPIAEPLDAGLEYTLDRLMTEERLYRDPDLTIGMIAARAGTAEYRVRRLINTGLGHRNVNAYLNGFRLREVSAALADRAQAEVPITTIALDAGFGSLSVFNRSFKAQFGETPSLYRKRVAAGGPSD
ncbi:helix-turn-helix transcriptional regulator [Sphingomonas glacialis]|uniref:AraC family transcriptional regulator n=1 Tax=Sphingomonas glacialis TaxID=658225 RepID=A0A502FJB9_9SPHN|nr:AraC family transcriptional regulator [Sphingomonas glacialis]TPG49342.1 AraC family transcriptional regulator [Sphingomonas glacialis]